MATISLQGVNKIYPPSNWVVHDFNLEIKDQEFVVLVGPSGCGKTTALRMIAGLEDISSGEIKIDGEVINFLPPGKRGVAMVFQDYALYPHMTVEENMSFALRMQRNPSIPKAEIDARVKEAASMLDLGPYLQRKPAALSGGQRQRVAMGRAICKKARVFLFDEPLSNLDAKLRSKMRGEIKKFHQETKVTTIYVTHDQLEAMTLADRIVVMRDGHIEQVGTPMEVYENPRSVFVATFIGSPGMNLFPGTLHAVDDKMFLQLEGTEQQMLLPPSKASLGHSGQKVKLGIRPSDVFWPEVTREFQNPQEIDPSWKVDGRVEMVELLGKNAYVSLKIGGHDGLSEIVGRKFPELKSTIPLGLNLHYAHLFHAESGINLHELK